MINWDIVSPKEVSIKDLENALEKDFPETYSGTAWRAAWRMYHFGYKKDKEQFLKQDGWGDFPYLKGLDLTGFMVGWAVNVLRWLLNYGAVRDGATVIIGGGENQPIGVSLKNCDGSLKDALGGQK